MKVLVTGGAGFIGAHLVAALVQAGDEVIALDNLRRGSRRALSAHASPALTEDGGASALAKGGDVRFVEGDVRDPALLASLLPGIQRVYHLAAQSNVLGAVDDLDYSFTSNVVGTYNVLAAAKAAGVERVVFTSSREVYGEVDALPVAEDRTLNPKNAYGASKVAGEVYCRAFQNTYGLDVSVLRLANVYGPGDRDRVIPIWLERARRGDDLELFGGAQVLDLVPIATVVAALRAAAERALDGQPVNVGSGRGTTLRRLAESVRALVRDSVDVVVLPARSIEVTRFVADVTLMQRILGVQPPADPLLDLPGLWDAYAGDDPTAPR